MKIFDTHCHYNLEPFITSHGQHWLKAQTFNVEKSMIVGTTVKSSKDAIEIASTNENFYASVGVHPHEYTSDYIGDHLLLTIEKDVSVLRSLITANPKVKAIGEIGLDYFFTKEAELETVRRIQRKALSHFLKLAVDTDLPVILHVRDSSDRAYNDMLEALHSHYHQSKKPFILHCVSGPETYVQEAISMGAYVSVAGNVTYKNADHIRTLVSLVPEDKLLIETDAPFLPPQQYRGKQCEPWMISLTAEFIQNELKRDLDQIYANSLTVFNLT